MSILSEIRRRLAGAPEEKASRAGPVVALNGVGRPHWSPRDYAALAREGFQKNPVAYRAVRQVAEDTGLPRNDLYNAALAEME